MVRLTIRIDLDTGSFGPGKVRLLEQIAATGSIRKAAGAMKMSYRRAWLLLQALEESFGAPLVETATGGKQGGGAMLSKLGRAVVAGYRRIEERAGHAAKADLRDMERFQRRSVKSSRKAIS
ncbi:MAG TPA: LysR family transcriptional regulator [Rhizomicrobium sp.]|jgi:molybdate transport system regulatory protein|nr:LysR family transcriptional regulator [Rhizomicrobium sp.]